MLDGADHDSVTCPLPPLAVAPVGVPGTVRGVTALEAFDGELVPDALVAITVKV